MSGDADGDTDDETKPGRREGGGRTPSQGREADD
jgi:hypothetical protein